MCINGILRLTSKFYLVHGAGEHHWWVGAGNVQAEVANRTSKAMYPDVVGRAQGGGPGNLRCRRAEIIVATDTCQRTATARVNINLRVVGGAGAKARRDVAACSGIRGF